MKLPARKRLGKWLFTLFTIYTLIGFAFYFLQDYILFHPVSLKGKDRFNFDYPHKEYSIPINEKDTLNVVEFNKTDSITRGIVLYFHGNKKNISWYAKYMPYFTSKGYEVMMIDYPGYGKSRGKLTEQKLYDWSMQAYKLAIKKFSADSIIIYGKSMGTGIAAELASKRDCKRLILESPYYDFPSVVQHYMPIWPVKWMLHYYIPTYQYITNVKAPISIFHGTRDRVVVYNNSIRLKKFLKPSDQLITIKGGHHNDLYDYPITREKLDSLLRQSPIVNREGLHPAF